MALITCPECKKSISDQASTCPQCGFPLAKKSNCCRECGEVVPDVMAIKCPSCRVGAPLAKVTKAEKEDVKNNASVEEKSAAPSSSSSVECSSESSGFGIGRFIIGCLIGIFFGLVVPNGLGGGFIFSMIAGLVFGIASATSWVNFICAIGITCIALFGITFAVNF